MELIKKNKDLIYLVTLSICLISMLLSNSILTVKTLYNFAPIISTGVRLIRYCTYIIFAVLIALDFYYSKTNKIMVLFVLIIGCITTLITKDFQLFSYILIILASAQVDFDKILKIYLYVQLFFVTLFILLTSTGILKDIVFDPGVRDRHSLGFIWTTFTPMLFFFILCYIFLYNARTMRTFEFLLLVFCCSSLYMLTDSRFIYFMQLLLVALFFVYNRYQDNIAKLINKKIIVTMLPLLPFIFFAVTFIVQLSYNPNNQLMLYLNNLLSQRLELGYNAIHEFGLSLFGKQIEWIGYGIGFDSTSIYNYVDCSYIQILLNYGIIVLFFVLIGYSLLIKYCLQNNKSDLLIIIITTLVINMIEPRLINIVFNPFVIYFSLFLKSNKIKHY